MIPTTPEEAREIVEQALAETNPDSFQRMDCAASIEQGFAELTRIIDRRDFGWAVRMLKDGKCVCRRGWNGKGQYLWLLPAATVRAEWCREPRLKAIIEAAGGEIECLGSVRMRTVQGHVLTGWLASQTDVLSEDWELVDDSTVVHRTLPDPVPAAESDPIFPPPPVGWQP